MTLEDPALMQARSAWIDRARAIGRRERTIGLVACLLGMLLLGWAATRGPGAYSIPGYAGLAIVAAGWLLFVYVTVKRMRWMHAHPFKS